MVERAGDALALHAAAAQASATAIQSRSRPLSSFEKTRSAGLRANARTRPMSEVTYYVRFAVRPFAPAFTPKSEQ